MLIRAETEAVPPPRLGRSWWRLIPIAFLQLFVVPVSSHFREDRADFNPVSIALLVLGVAVLPWRYRYPQWILAATTLTTAGYFAAGGPVGPFAAAFAMASVNAIMQGYRIFTVLAMVAGLVLAPLLALWLGPVRPLPPWPSLIAFGTFLAALFAIAELSRVRRHRAIEQQRQKEQEQRRRADEERLRIAREIHDSVAHNMALINLQAGVALHLADDLPEQTRSALMTIRTSSKEALVELRSILGVLRSADAANSRAPVPGLDQLDEVIERAQAAGLKVELGVSGDRSRVGTVPDRAAFRIIQEALTNVAKHSETKRARITLTVTEETLDVVVKDAGSGPGGRPDLEGGGNGIIGMRERAAAADGKVEVGPDPAGGWKVHAELPIGRQQ